MIVKLDGPLRRTRKKLCTSRRAPLMRFVARARFILIPAVAAVVVGAFFLKDGVPVNYIKMFDNPDQEKIEAVFGLENQTVVLYDKNTPDEAVRQLHRGAGGPRRRAQRGGLLQHRRPAADLFRAGRRVRYGAGALRRRSTVFMPTV